MMTNHVRKIRKRQFWRGAFFVLVLALVIAIVSVDNPVGNWVRDTVSGNTVADNPVEVTEDLEYMYDLIEGGHMLGNEDAPVVILEFSDFQCPYCGRAAQDAVAQIKENYVESGDVLFVFKNLPLSFHDNAQKAAEAAECAADQDMFWEMHDWMFANQATLDVDSLKAAAVKLGMDADEFNSCLDSGEKADVVAEQAAQATGLGISGTPNFIVNGKEVSGAQPFSVFQQEIELILNGGVSDEPLVSLTVISDATCASCDTASIISVLEQQFYLNLDITEYDYADSEAQDLIEEYDITALPAYIFGSDVSGAMMFAELEPALVEFEDSYLVSPMATGIGKYIGDAEIGDRNMMGDEDAPVEMVIFSDFQCPYCQMFEIQTLPSIIENYVETGQVKLFFRHFPLSFHENAQKAAEAAECAADQDMFWEMHDVMFENNGALDVDSLKTYAGELGMDTEQFNACLDSGEKAGIVSEDMDLGMSLGVSGTPASFIDGALVSGAQPYENVASIIDAALAA